MNEKISANRDNKDWTEQSQRKAQSIRDRAVEFGLNEKQLLLGLAVYQILQDDEINFITPQRQDYEDKIVRVSKESVLFRLEWEINLGVLPAKLQKQLELTLSDLKTIEWYGKSNFTFAHKKWLNKVRKPTDRERKNNKEVKEAYNLYVQYQPSIG